MAIIFNCLLYRINTKTFRLFYEKPKFEIINSFATPTTDSVYNSFDSLISLTITNPSSFDNEIYSYFFKSFYTGATITTGTLGLKLPKSSHAHHNIELNFEEAKKFRGRLMVLVLTDLKGNKTRKRFRFMPRYKS